MMGHFHVVPIDDLRPHQEDKTCWCKPTLVEHSVFMHHAMDGREKFETGERKPS